MKLGLDPHFTNEHEGLVFEHKLWGLLWCKPPKWVIQPILGNHTGFYQPKLTFWQIWNLGIFPKLTGSVCVGKICPICGDGPKPTPCFWETAINHTGNPKWRWIIIGCVSYETSTLSPYYAYLHSTPLCWLNYICCKSEFGSHTHIYIHIQYI